MEGLKMFSSKKKGAANKSRLMLYHETASLFNAKGYAYLLSFTSQFRVTQHRK